MKRLSFSHCILTPFPAIAHSHQRTMKSHFFYSNKQQGKSQVISAGTEAKQGVPRTLGMLSIVTPCLLELPTQSPYLCRAYSCLSNPRNWQKEWVKGRKDVINSSNPKYLANLCKGRKLSPLPSYSLRLGLNQVNRRQSNWRQSCNLIFSHGHRSLHRKMKTEKPIRSKCL